MGGGRGVSARVLRVFQSTERGILDNECLLCDVTRGSVGQLVFGNKHLPSFLVIVCPPDQSEPARGAATGLLCSSRTHELDT